MVNKMIAKHFHGGVDTITENKVKTILEDAIDLVVEVPEPPVPPTSSSNRSSKKSVAKGVPAEKASSSRGKPRPSSHRKDVAYMAYQSPAGSKGKDRGRHRRDPPAGSNRPETPSAGRI